jgi:phosphatidylinositol alpha-1,6-mannosyltransferase
MPRTLLVTNDFPPRTGGIQAYLGSLAALLPQDELVVYAPDWPGAEAFDRSAPYAVHRHHSTLMLPLPDVVRRAAALARAEHCDTVWFGAAAPLALLGPALRRQGGIEHVVASTHGHEVGLSRVPGGIRALRRIGRTTDVLTAVSGFTQSRLGTVVAPAAAPVLLPPGVDTEVYRPDSAARTELRERYRLGTAPVIACVSRLVRRKGQDELIATLPAVRARVPGTTLLLVGGGPEEPRLRRLARRHGVGEHVVFAGRVPTAELAAHHAVGDVFALPCRTRYGGANVEGLGIAALEAAACGLPVVVGDAGGAPETVRPGETGLVVDGTDRGALAASLCALLADPQRAAAMGSAGREWMRQDWCWPAAVLQLQTVLAGSAAQRA